MFWTCILDKQFVSCVVDFLLWRLRQLLFHKDRSQKKLRSARSGLKLKTSELLFLVISRAFCANFHKKRFLLIFQWSDRIQKSLFVLVVQSDCTSVVTFRQYTLVLVSFVIWHRLRIFVKLKLISRRRDHIILNCASALKVQSLVIWRWLDN